MAGQGFQTSSSSQNTGPQSVAKSNPGAPPLKKTWLLLTLVFFRMKIKAPTWFLHALIGLHHNRHENNTAACLAKLPGQKQAVRPKADRLSLQG